MRHSRLSLWILWFVLSTQASNAQVLPLPPRPSDTPSREQIVQILSALTRSAREDSLFQWVMKGYVPDFMRALVPVTSTAPIGGIPYAVTYYVSPDYLAVGSDERYFLAPMTPLLAQRLCDALQCTLPTRKMVNDIWAAAQLKLAPAPIAPSAAMITVPVFAQHDSMVWAQRSPLLAAFPPGTLVGGTKKDVIISNRIRNDLKNGVPKPVVIYGWHYLSGVAIQPIWNGHEETYADYSHGIRLVQQAIQMNGSSTTISALLKDQTLHPILSDEGPIPFPRYGDAPVEVEADQHLQPGVSAIFQNYPNPFNPTTNIGYRIGDSGMVKLAVYDLLGREVAVLVNEWKAPGSYVARFSAMGESVTGGDAGGLAAGIYFYRLTARQFTQTRRMILMK